MAILAILYSKPSAAEPDAADAGDVGASLQEVVVTATRRAVSAQDLPISITAISGDSLEKAGIADIAGLAHSMAGVNYTDKGPFGGVTGANLIIRGLNSETTSGLPAGASPVVAPVATYIDDTPLLVNLRLQDLDRVEVLRGPQGTLYGSGSLGGTIRFVQNAPDPSAFDAKIETSISKTKHTHALNEDVNGVLNLPVSDTFAVRLNAGWTDDAGFINQPNLYALDASGVPLPAQPGAIFSDPIVRGREGVNSYQYRNARVAALWKPSDDFKIQLSYYYQGSNADGFPYIATSQAGYNQPVNAGNLPSGNFTNPPVIPQFFNGPVPPGVDQLSDPENSASTTRDTVNMVALALEYDMGFATLTSSTSWAHHVNQTTADETAEYENFFGFPQDLYGQNPRMFIQGKEDFDDKPWSQEIRLTSKTGGRFEWVGGLFYKNQTTVIQEHDYYPGYNSFYNACAPVYGPSPADFNTPSYCGVGDTSYVPGTTTVINGVTVNLDQAFVGDFHTRFKDLALFGELTGHVTSAWSITGGTRLFKQTVTQSQQTALLFLAAPQFGSPPTNNTSGDTWRRALWKFNTAYQFDANNLAYATWSQGFRRGSVNALPANAGGVPTPPDYTKVEPDTVDNYEIGVKGTVDNRLRYSAAIYDMEWHKVQELVQLTPVVLPGVLNVGDAYSRGLELELDAVLSQHLTAHLGYTYDKTKLTKLSPLYVSPYVAGLPPAVGIALPGTPKNSAALSLEYGHMPLAGGELRYAINAHYQGEVASTLSASAPPVGGYTMVDTRLSFTKTHWNAALFVNNLTDNLGITSYQDPLIFGNRYMAIVSQPRTFGLTIGYSFKE